MFQVPWQSCNVSMTEQLHITFIIIIIQCLMHNAFIFINYYRSFGSIQLRWRLRFECNFFFNFIFHVEFSIFIQVISKCYNEINQFEKETGKKRSFNWNWNSCDRFGWTIYGNTVKAHLTQEAHNYIIVIHLLQVSVSLNDLIINKWIYWTEFFNAFLA